MWPTNRTCCHTRNRHNQLLFRRIVFYWIHLHSHHTCIHWGWLRVFGLRTQPSEGSVKFSSFIIGCIRNLTLMFFTHILIEQWNHFLLWIYFTLFFSYVTLSTTVLIFLSSEKNCGDFFVVFVGFFCF